MQNSSITRFAGGVTSAVPGSVLENYKEPNPAFYHRLFSDFDLYNAADWVVTATGAATESLTNVDGGVLQLLNSAANNDLVSLQWAGGTGAVNPTFLFDATKDFVFAASLYVNNATNAAFLAGLTIADTTPIATLPATGMFIQKPAATTFPQGYIRDSGAGAVTAQNSVAMVNSTFMDMAIVYSALDGATTLYLGAPGLAPSSQFRVSGAPSPAPGALLAPIFALQNGTAAATAMGIDWWLAAKPRR